LNNPGVIFLWQAKHLFPDSSWIPNATELAQKKAKINKMEKSVIFFIPTSDWKT
jgi:hypothetical protein